MGAWGNSFFENDRAASLAEAIALKYFGKSATREALLKWLQSTPPEVEEADILVSISFLQNIHNKLSTPQYQDSKKIKNFLSTLSMTDPGFGLTSIISHCLIDRPKLESFLFTSTDIQALYEATIEAVFHEKDKPYFLAETLTSFGTIYNSQDLLKNPTLDIVYRPSNTNDPKMSFYATALIISQLHPNGAHNVITPYVFKQFLNAASIYLSTEELSGWDRGETRFEAISKELELVVSAVAKTPAHIKVLGEHYDYIVAHNERAKPQDQRLIGSYFGSGSLVPIVNILPPEPKAYEKPTTKMILEKYTINKAMKHSITKQEPVHKMFKL